MTMKESLGASLRRPKPFNELVSRPNSPLIHDLHKEKKFLLRSFLQTVLKLKNRNDRNVNGQCVY